MGNARQFTYEQLDVAMRRFDHGGEKVVDVVHAEETVVFSVLNRGSFSAVSLSFHAALQKQKEQERRGRSDTQVSPAIPRFTELIRFLLPLRPRLRLNFTSGLIH